MSKVEYAVYKGEELIVMGTAKECATRLKVEPRTIQFYNSPVYKKRVEARKNPKNFIIAVRLDEDE